METLCSPGASNPFLHLPPTNPCRPNMADTTDPFDALPDLCLGLAPVMPLHSSFLLDDLLASPPTPSPSAPPTDDAILTFLAPPSEASAVTASATPPPPPVALSVPAPAPFAAPFRARPPGGATRAVERCRAAAEDFANAEVESRNRKARERKRKAGEAVSEDDDDDGVDDEPGQRPEDVSHRKYQKRLQKNRNSAFVSRIRRREYTRILEESLVEKEGQADEFASAYKKVKMEYDNVCSELAALKEAAKSRAVEIGRAIIRPVGDGGGSGTSGTAVVTMFMFALMFGIMMPEMRDGAGSRTTSPVVSSGSSVVKSNVNGMRSSKKHPLMYDESCLAPIMPPLKMMKDEALIANQNALPQPPPISSVKEEPIMAALEVGHISATSCEGRVWASPDPSLPIDAITPAVASLSSITSASYRDQHDDEHMSDPDSPCPTMVDIDGDLASEETFVSRPILDLFERTCSSLLGPKDANAVVQVVQRNLADGKVSTQSVAVLAKKSARAAAASSEATTSSSSTSSFSGKADEEDLSSQAFAKLLRGLTAVTSDHKFSSHVKALIAFKLIVTPESAVLKRMAV